MGQFGDKFRNTREKKELSLDDVSNVTKINARMLQAIEEEHFDRLPGGVFNRGFIRAYAKHLGLNAEDAVNDYLACLSQAQIDFNSAWEAERLRDQHLPAVSESGTAHSFRQVAKPEQPSVQVEELPELQLPRIEHVRQPRRIYLRRYSSEIPWIWVAAVLCVVMITLLFWTGRHRTTRAARTVSKTAPASRPSVPAPVALPSPLVATPPASAAPVAAPRSPRPSAQSSMTAIPNPPAADLAPGPAIQAETRPDPDAVRVETKPDVTIRSFGDRAAKPAEKPALKLTVVVRARENTWISVTSDGQLVTQETLIAPAATTFRAARELVVRVANGAAVSFLCNGQELLPQGAEGGAKTFIFDDQGMHTAESPQPPAQN